MHAAITYTRDRPSLPNALLPLRNREQAQALRLRGHARAEPARVPVPTSESATADAHGARVEAKVLRLRWAMHPWLC